jgi:hypothetical protein
MSYTVWKFPVEAADQRITLPMPVGADVLTFQVQGGKTFLWALVDPNAATEQREFLLLPTGGPGVADVGRYHGTVQLFGGSLVLHLFDAPEKEAADGQEG